MGKTMMCLNSMIAMLVQDESSQAVWIETVDHEFSAQRASDAAKAFILSRKDQRQGPQESNEEDLALEVSFNVALLCLGRCILIAATNMCYLGPCEERTL